MKQFILIGLGAALGANARYWLGVLIGARLAHFPFGTLFVNVTGSFILGFLLSWGGKRPFFSEEMKLFLAVGFLGSYTTFSSYAVNSWQLAEQYSWGMGLINIIANNILALSFAGLGIYLGR